MILRLERFWADYGCIIMQPYNSEVGAGTFNPATFIKVIEDKPYKTAYLEISKRPKDGRYAENPNRFQQFYQFQVILQPSPSSVIDIFLESLEFLGIKLKNHDLRFVEDDWESPTLGAWGVGWEVRLDGMEITQFTYFQQMGGFDLRPIPVELTYGLERIGMCLQRVDNVFDLRWNPEVRYKDLQYEAEVEFSRYNFEEVQPTTQLKLFGIYEEEAKRLLKNRLYLPAYDYVLKCSHTFNLLDARGALGAGEKERFIKRVRYLANRCAHLYLNKEESRV